MCVYLLNVNFHFGQNKLNSHFFVIVTGNTFECTFVITTTRKNMSVCVVLLFYCLFGFVLPILHMYICMYVTGNKGQDRSHQKGVVHNY